MNKYIILMLLFTAITACDTSIKQINYAEDQCDFCSMRIVQKTHGAQLATQKGKQYKFDAIECMVNYIKKESTKFEGATLFVTNFNKPGEMIPAENAAYLISKNLPSPMGANLTAFASIVEAEEAQKRLSGKIHQWNDLEKVIKKDVQQH